MSALSSAFGLTKLDEHLPTLLLSVGCFFTLQLIARAFGVRESASARVCSMAHALVIVPLAYRAMDSESLAADKAFGWDARAGLTVAVCCGYFLWDIVYEVFASNGLGFVAHGVACFLVYILGFTPFAAYYGIRCLMFEISTPFLNIHWFLLKTGRGDSVAATVNGVFLLSSFFLARLVYGSYVSYTFFQTMFSIRDQVPLFHIVVYSACNIVLTGLNWYWFSRMISSLLGRKAKAKV